MRKIRLTQGKYALVDNRDYKELSKHNWQYSMGRALRFEYIGMHNGKKKETTVAMHQQIMGIGKDNKQTIQHRNGNGLDNRRRNLRVCDCRSRYKFVYRAAYSGRWFSSRLVDGRRVVFGTYGTQEEAKAAYDYGIKLVQQGWDRRRVLQACYDHVKATMHPNVDRRKT